MMVLGVAFNHTAQGGIYRKVPFSKHPAVFQGSLIKGYLYMIKGYFNNLQVTFVTQPKFWRICNPSKCRDTVIMAWQKVPAAKIHKWR